VTPWLGFGVFCKIYCSINWEGFKMSRYEGNILGALKAYKQNQLSADAEGGNGLHPKSIMTHIKNMELAS